MPRIVRAPVGASLAAVALSIVAVAIPAVAAPAPLPPSSTDRTVPTSDCGAALRDLTTALRQAGFSGQASHVAAQLTLGC